MLEKLFDMKPIGWNSPSSCCCNRTAPVVKLDASHSRQKGPDLDGKASMGAEVMVLFSTSKACCLAAPHDQSFDFWVSMWRGQAILEKLRLNLWRRFRNPRKNGTSLALKRAHNLGVLRITNPKEFTFQMFKLEFLWLKEYL